MKAEELGGKVCMKGPWKRRARMQGLEVLSDPAGEKNSSLKAGRKRGRLPNEEQIAHKENGL